MAWVRDDDAQGGDPRQALEGAWARTDELLAQLVDPRWAARPLDDRHPLLQQLGHTTARALELLGEAAPSPDPALDDLFLRDGPAPDEPARSWPDADTVRAYAAAARQTLRQALAGGDPTVLRRGGEVLVHELLHHEVLQCLLTALPGEAKRPRPGQAPGAGDMAAPRRALRIAPPDGRGPALRIDSTPIMVGEFHEFVLDGGYDQAGWWGREAWELRRARGLRHPTRWRQVGAEWLLRGLAEDLPLTRVFDLPAPVSHGEARAYLAWRDQDLPAARRRRLPTLDELLQAGLGTRRGERRRWPWGEAPPDGSRVALGPRRSGPVPVGHAGGGASDWGLLDLIGNGWEWTDTTCETRDGEPARWVVGGSWASDPALVARRPWLPLPPGAAWLPTQFRGVSEESDG